MNIGRNGVTTNAGIPGTGLSYRSKVGSKGGALGILALVAGRWLLGLPALEQNRDTATLPPPMLRPASRSAAITASIGKCQRQHNPLCSS